MSIPQHPEVRTRCRAAIRLGLCALLVLAACRKTSPEPRDAGTTTAAADADADAADPCPPLPPGSVTDEDHPTLRGGGPRVVDPYEWLEGRGVSRTSAVAWQTQRYGTGKDVPPLGSCAGLTVGMPPEEALLCEVEPNTSELMPERGVILVVRKKRLAAVLDVGLGLRAMDWEGVRDLDLTLAVEADGVHASVFERAPEGSTLVESQAACRARFKSASHGIPPPPAYGVPAKLTGCAQAHTSMKADVASQKGDWRLQQETRGSLAFVDKSCAERGAYLWAGDRFVRQPAPR